MTLLLGSFTFAQKKTTTKPIVKPAPLESPKVNYPKEAVDKCYIYTAEEKKRQPRSKNRNPYRVWRIIHPRPYYCHKNQL